MPSPRPLRSVSELSPAEKKYAAAAFVAALSGLALSLSVALDPGTSQPGAETYRARAHETLERSLGEVEALEAVVRAERAESAEGADAEPKVLDPPPRAEASAAAAGLVHPPSAPPEGSPPTPVTAESQASGLAGRLQGF